MAKHALTADDLDVNAHDALQDGDDPNRQVIFLTPRYHDHAQMTVMYEKGVLTLFCAQCGNAAERIAVARETRQ